MVAARVAAGARAAADWARVRLLSDYGFAGCRGLAQTIGCAHI